MAGQHADGVFTLLHTTADKAAAQQGFATAVMQPLGKPEAFALLQTNAPARQNTGQLAHIGLRIATIKAQRVQFHQFASVVFIDPAHVTLRLVQIKQHGWMASAGQQHVLKLAQCIGANHVHNIVANKRPHRAFACKNIQVVEPELGHAGQHRVFKCRVAA